MDEWRIGNRLQELRNENNSTNRRNDSDKKYFGSKKQNQVNKIRKIQEKQKEKR